MAIPNFRIRDNLNVDYRSLRPDAMDLFSDAMEAKNEKPVLSVSIDATHSGRLTNMRVYPGARVKRSMKTFLEPVGKPVLKHHDMRSDPIGRVAGAKFVQLKHGDDFKFDYRNPGKDTGSGFIQLDLNVMEQDSIEQFIDGRIQQFSTSQDFKDVFCSVCGKNISDEMTMWWNEHEHKVGETYKVKVGKKTKDYLCYLITGDLTYVEVSPVNIPADEHTKVNSFKFIEPNKDFDGGMMECFSDSAASVNSMSLSTGSDSIVDLLAGSHDSAKDRKTLTGKTIVAVSPLFTDLLQDQQEEEDMSKKNKSEDNKDETLEEKETPDANAASEASEDNSNKDGSSEEEEGVVAPVTEAKVNAESDQSGLSEKAITASLEAVTAQLETLKTEKAEADSQITRLEAKLLEKDEEVTKAKTAATDSLTETKAALAGQLLTARLVLSKEDVTSISTKDEYEAKLASFTERKLDSLKDSISDLSLEVAAAMKKLGVKSSADFAADTIEDDVTSTATDSKEKVVAPKPKTKDEALNSYFNTTNP